jgi:hypothetical protein
MPDIMMCLADNCCVSNKCYRHSDSGTKPDTHRQSFWLRDGQSPVGPECPNYWPSSSLSAKLDKQDPHNSS